MDAQAVQLGPQAQPDYAPGLPAKLQGGDNEVSLGNIPHPRQTYYKADRKKENSGQRCLVAIRRAN